ncbi:MAG: hypothetical protein KJ731_15800 [Alphaproteobacteria bacterium]|nr:hypothetical protein [Alphaproteobacteria bacterium]MBU1280255.1 hypothetical protein [Alphaproteobacteria bacterium]MBU1572994.1 hypothetical protein [Alphaproteobacteria bacterium]MBU1829915.1 hypothetical protein [Alphaproteobacteria bacterium]MBU2079953.1 hypothetical protein [Alphaproteobacteria bacterium]
MVQVVGWAFTAITGLTGSLSVFGVTLVGAGGALTLAGSLVNIALINAAKGAFAKGQSAPSPDDIKTVFKQTVGQRFVHKGEVLTGGQVVFRRAKNGFYHQVTVHGHGGPYTIMETRLDGDVVEIDVENFVANKYLYDTDDGGFWDPEGGLPENVSRRVYVETRTGQIPETHYSELTSYYPVWTENHRLDGLCSTYMRRQQVPAESYRDVFPTDPPVITLILRSPPVYDPRSDSDAYSDNAALQIADFIASPDGLNMPVRVNMDWLSAAADDCDDAIPLAGGGTEPRYRISMTYSMTEAPQYILGRMLASCGSDIVLLPDGTFGIRAGKYDAPTVTLTSRDIIGFDEVNNGPDLLDYFTELPFTYTDRSLDYVSVTGDPWVREDLEAEFGASLVADTFDLSAVPSHGQARRLAKLKSYIDNPEKRITVRLHPRGLRAIRERLVALDFGILSGTYLIEKAPIIDSNTLQVTLQLSQFDFAATTWSTAEEGLVQTRPDDDTPSTIPTLANFNAAPSGVQTAQNSWAAAIGVAWDAPVSDALTPRIEVSPAGADTWTTLVVTAIQTSVNSGILTDGALYDVRGCLVTPGGTKGAYVIEENVPALAVSTAPDAPSSLIVTDNADGTANVEVTASASASNWKTQVLRDSVVIFEFASEAGVVLEFTDSPGAGTYDYTAKAINVSQIESVLTPTVTATIT